MARSGWSEKEVRAQILTPIEENTLRNPSPADVASIMCYSFPGSVTKNGQPINGATAAFHSIAQAALSDIGNYAVQVSNGVGAPEEALHLTDLVAGGHLAQRPVQAGHGSR